MIICYKPEKRQKREIPQPMFNLLSSRPLFFLSSCPLVFLSSCPLVLSCHALEDVIAGEYSELASLAEIGNSFFFIAELQINKSPVKIGLA